MEQTCDWPNVFVTRAEMGKGPASSSGTWSEKLRFAPVNNWLPRPAPLVFQATRALATFRPGQPRVTWSVSPGETVPSSELVARPGPEGALTREMTCAVMKGISIFGRRDA